MGEMESVDDWSPALADVQVVVHLAARVHVMKEHASDPLALFRRANVTAAERLARAAARNGVQRFVFPSTAGVHGNACDKAITECSPIDPRTPYTQSKWEGESALKQVSKDTGIDLVILRPPLVYGPGNPGNMLRLLRLVSLGIPLPLGSVTNARSFVFVENLANAIMLCCIDARAENGTFLIRDDEELPTPELISRLAAASARPARLFNFPPNLVRRGMKLLGHGREASSLIDSFSIDDCEFRKRLGWNPPFTTSEGLRQTAAWYTQSIRSR